MADCCLCGHYCRICPYRLHYSTDCWNDKFSVYFVISRIRTPRWWPRVFHGGLFHFPCLVLWLNSQVLLDMVLQTLQHGYLLLQLVSKMLQRHLTLFHHLDQFMRRYWFSLQFSELRFSSSCTANQQERSHLVGCRSHTLGVPIWSWSQHPRRHQWQQSHSFQSLVQDKWTPSDDVCLAPRSVDFHLPSEVEFVTGFCTALSGHHLSHAATSAYFLGQPPGSTTAANRW